METSGQLRNRLQGALRAVVKEIRRGLISPEDAQPDRCHAIALWTHMAAQQLPELKFNPNARV